MNTRDAFTETLQITRITTYPMLFQDTKLVTASKSRYRSKMKVQRSSTQSCLTQKTSCFLATRRPIRQEVHGSGGHMNTVNVCRPRKVKVSTNHSASLSRLHTSILSRVNNDMSVNSQHHVKTLKNPSNFRIRIAQIQYPIPKNQERQAKFHVGPQMHDFFGF